MGLKDFYSGFFASIKNIISWVESIKKVNVGEALRISELPMAIVLPRETRFPAMITKQFQCRITFDVIIVIRETEPSNWFDDIVQPMGDVFDALLSSADLTLIPLLFSPGEITAQNKLYYGGLLRFEGIIYYSI
jgi:hypothetical protein